MLNYSVKLNSIKDLMELRKMADRFDITGTINQNGFHGDMRSVLKNILYLPLEDATVEIDGYKDSQVNYISEAITMFSA